MPFKFAFCYWMHIFAKTVNSVVMDDIKVYGSVRKTLMTLLGCLVFVAMGVICLLEGVHFVAWLCIAFFGAGALLMLFVLLRNRISGKPVLSVTDRSVIMHGIKDFEISFADVDSFSLTKVMGENWVAVKFRLQAEERKMADAGIVGKAARKLNTEVAGAPEAIPADGLSISARQLCDLLSERLSAYAKSHA